MFPAKFSFLPALVVTSLLSFHAAAQPAFGSLNTRILPGFNLISNPLSDPTNTLARILRFPELPDGLTIYVMIDGEFVGTTYDSESGAFEPADLTNHVIEPGSGFFVYNPLPTETFITFAGEILQGTLVNPLPSGYSIAASKVLLTGTLEELGFPKAPGDRVYTWDAVNQRFNCSYYDDLDEAWLPGDQVLQSGQAFILWKAQPADWVQHLSLNP